MTCSQCIFLENTTIFTNDELNGQEFLECIKLESYYLIYADIKALKGRLQITNINTYDDFVNSSCEIALFYTDSVEIELYCKNIKLLKQIINNCKRFGFGDLQVLTEESDFMRIFSI